MTSETSVNERSLADVDSTQVPAETEGAPFNYLYRLHTFIALTNTGGYALAWAYVAEPD